MTAGSRRRPPWRMLVWLTLVWLMLWGRFSTGTLLAGVAIAALVTTALPLPAVEFKGRIHPVATAHLIGRFILDLVRASIQVALLALSPRRSPRGAVIRVHLRSESDLYLTLTAELSTLVPGSLVVEANRQTGVLYLHVLDVDALGGIEKIRTDTLGTEARVLRALASDGELAAAGLTRRGRDGRGEEQT
ncbi:MAG TPA: Na+/H+ antiporter subunit E [Acidimicrobiia bacterium]|nr:Na+/H+ antiporter subunit E [Acidimicrobiia bacterium]